MANDKLYTAVSPQETKGNGNVNLDDFRKILEFVWDKAKPNTLPDPTTINAALDKLELELWKVEDNFGTGIDTTSDGFLIIDYDNTRFSELIKKG